jgi:secreted trypsin-like serine protease
MTRLIRPVAAIVLFLLLSPITPAIAVEGGDLAVNSPYVAALLQGKDASRPKCSAAYIDPLVVITAAHCVTSLNSESGSLSSPPNSFWVSPPGQDLNYSGIKSVRVKAIFRSVNYVNTWRPEVGDFRTQVDDIAFLVLESPMPGVVSIEIATSEEVLEVKKKGAQVFHIGYGSQSKTQLDGKPYSISLTAHPLGSTRYSNNPALESHTITSNETGQKAICGGDSGSPWYSDIAGTRKLIAVTVGGSGCGGSGVNGALGTVASQYSELYEQAQTLAGQIRRGAAAQNIRLRLISQTTFASCSRLRRIFPDGIAFSKAAAANESQTRLAFVSRAGYLANKKLDKDKDGIVCER